MYAVRRTTLQRIRSKPINKPMPLLLANYHKGSDAFSCESKVLVPFTWIYFTGRWLGFSMQWIVLHTFFGYLDKTVFLKNDIFLFLVSFLDCFCWRLWKCSMQPHFEGVCVTSSYTTYMPPAAFEIQIIQPGRRWSLSPSHSLRANCYLPAKTGLIILQSTVGSPPRVERVEHYFQLEKIQLPLIGKGPLTPRGKSWSPPTMREEAHFLKQKRLERRNPNFLKRRWTTFNLQPAGIVAVCQQVWVQLTSSRTPTRERRWTSGWRRIKYAILSNQKVHQRRGNSAYVDMYCWKTSSSGLGYQPKSK